MSKLSLVIVLVIGVIVIIGAVFVMTWEIPPPTTKVEKVIPNARFPR